MWTGLKTGPMETVVLIHFGNNILEFLYCSYCSFFSVTSLLRHAGEMQTVFPSMKTSFKQNVFRDFFCALVIGKISVHMNLCVPPLSNIMAAWELVKLNSFFVCLWLQYKVCSYFFYVCCFVHLLFLLFTPYKGFMTDFHSTVAILCRTAFSSCHRIES